VPRRPTTLLVAFGTVVSSSDGLGSLRCRYLRAGGSGSCLEGKMRLKKRARREERMRNDDVFLESFWGLNLVPWTSCTTTFNILTLLCWFVVYFSMLPWYLLALHRIFVLDLFVVIVCNPCSTTHTSNKYFLHHHVYWPHHSFLLYSYLGLILYFIGCIPTFTSFTSFTSCTSHITHAPLYFCFFFFLLLFFVKSPILNFSKKLNIWKL